MLLEERDEGQEELAVEAVAVEVVGRGVRGRDERHAAREQLFEQPAEQHGVGDVLDLELVEAEEPGVRDDRLGDRRDGVGIALAALGFPERGDRGVHLVHELVEVDAALLRRFDRGEEEVHEHGLAAPDLADEVGAADRLAAGEKAAAGLRRRRPRCGRGRSPRGTGWDRPKACRAGRGRSGRW